MGNRANANLDINGRLIQMGLKIKAPYVRGNYSTLGFVFIDGFPKRVDISNPGHNPKTIAFVDAVDLYRFEEGAALTPQQMEEIIMAGWRSLLEIKPQLSSELRALIVPDLEQISR